MTDSGSTPRWRLALRFSDTLTERGHDKRLTCFRGQAFLLWTKPHRSRRIRIQNRRKKQRGYDKDGKKANQADGMSRMC